jgi:hypothetical protein
LCRLADSFFFDSSKPLIFNEFSRNQLAAKPRGGVPFLASEVNITKKGDRSGRSIYPAGNVMCTIHDELGREATKLVDEKKETGKYVMLYDNAGLASGRNACPLTAGDFVRTKRMRLVR